MCALAHICREGRGLGHARMTYVLFRQRSIPSCFCAVPAGEPAPGFIDAQAWAFAGLHMPDQAPSDQFDEAAARRACKEHGFYIYRAAGPHR